MRVLFLSNHEVTLYYFRVELIKKLIEDGNDVVISQPFGEHKAFFESLGCHCCNSEITQYGMNPLKETSLIKDYKKLIKTVKPDIVVTYTIKPNLYGGMASAKYGVPYISTITGLGGAFEKGTLFRRMTVALYKRATRKIAALFFQNKSASDLFDSFGIAKGKHVIVNGSGVNLEKYLFSEYPEEGDDVNLLYVGRIMNDKGVRELFDAVSNLKKNGIKVSLDAVGWCEDDCRELLDDAISSGTVDYHGWQNDVRPFIEKCNAVVLPSYHEGMANVLLEAEACGRPVLASNIHGCIETFDEGITGFGFEPRDSASFENAIRQFVQLPHSRKSEMGRRAREKVQKEFDRNTVVKEYTNTIYKFGGHDNGSL